ncbi:MAG: hypothetical protein V1744_07885 [Candidatus Altiarchaeota archaeon]
MKSSSHAVAYPGLPVVFAEGFREYRRRISGHSHASLAITDEFEKVRTETKAYATDSGIEFTLDGASPHGPRVKGALDMIRKMQSEAVEYTGIKVDSLNHNILTGSSDSGAAALVTAVDELLGLGLPMERMIELSRGVSETAYRSLVGGLSQCTIDREGKMKVTQLARASFFRDLIVYAIPFTIKRLSADDLHLRVVGHPHYPKRSDESKKHIGQLQDIVDRKDLLGFMALMEAEAETVHGMFNDMGMSVIRGEMKDAVNLVAGMRERGLQVYWNVAGGSQVYVFTLEKWVKEVSRELKDHDLRYKRYKVADGAKTL